MLPILVTLARLSLFVMTLGKEIVIAARSGEDVHVVGDTLPSSLQQQPGVSGEGTLNPMFGMVEMKTKSSTKLLKGKRVKTKPRAEGADKVTANPPGLAVEADPEKANHVATVAETLKLTRYETTGIVLVAVLWLTVSVLCIFVPYSTTNAGCIATAWGGEERAAWCSVKNHFPHGIWEARECNCVQISVPGM